VEERSRLVNRTIALCLLVLTPLALALTACTSGSDGGPGPGDTLPPGISQISIEDGATGVGLVERIEVTFSEPIDEATVNDATFGVNERSVAGYVEYDAATRTASFTPDTLYAAESPYELFMTDDVTDEAGNPMTAFTRSFETGPLDCGHLDDRFEPNDQLSEAAPIELDRRYRMLTLCQTDEDKYAFTVDEALKVRLHEWMKHSDEGENNVKRSFLRSDGDEYVSANWEPGTGDSAASFRYTFPAGTYYLEVDSSDEPVYTLYEFTLATESPCPDDEYEENDFLDEAVLITPGTITGLRACWQDRDFFAIDMTAGQLLSVIVTSGPNAGSRYFQFYDPLGGLAGGSVGDSNPFQAWGEATETGTHFFMIRFYKDDVEYDIDVEVID
jgi:hypothetical protein